MSPLTIKGLVEFQEAMSHLPEHLTDEANNIVHDAATGAFGETFVGYPRKSGKLRQGLTIETHRTRTTAKVIVKSTAEHASDYEKGTTERTTRKGWKRGQMPPAQPGHAMIPIARRWRARMVEDLIAMVERAGFTITRS